MHDPEWYCPDDETLWGLDDEGTTLTDPGCWICGKPGMPRRTDPLRPGLPVIGGYASPGQTFRETTRL